jgi:hypothetical protein
MLAPRPAHADEIDRCLTAHPMAQRLRQDGALVSARTELLVCARAVCPAVVRAECGRWLAEVEDLTPSIVVSAQSVSGADLTDVRVFADGRAVAERLDGRAMPLDPGPHKIQLQAGGYEPTEMDVLLREREKARPLTFKMKDSSPKSVARSSEQRRSVGEPTETRPVPAVVYVLGAVGILAMGSFVGFGAAGRADYFELKDRCGPGCAASDVAPMRTELLIADVSLGVSVLALAGATYLFLTRPTLRESPLASSAFSF